MMTSSNGNIFRVTGHLCVEPVNSPHKGQWRGALMFSLICTRINGWVNNNEAVDLRRHRAHYDAIVMILFITTAIHSAIEGLRWIMIFGRKWDDLAMIYWKHFTNHDANGPNSASTLCLLWFHFFTASSDQQLCECGESPNWSTASSLCHYRLQWIGRLRYCDVTHACTVMSFLADCPATFYDDSHINHIQQPGCYQQVSRIWNSYITYTDSQ